jgi:hypothetical protein
MGSIVTESATFPVIVPVIAAAGAAGTARASSRERTTSVEVAARRKSVELILESLLRKRRGCGALVLLTNYRVTGRVFEQ